MTEADAPLTVDWMVRQYGFDRTEVEDWVRNLHFNWPLSVKALDENGNVRSDLGLKPGAKLLWSVGEDRALHLAVCEPPPRKGAMAMLGWARTFTTPKTTAECMRELREGEEDDES